MTDIVGFEHDLTRRLGALDLKTDRAQLLAPRRPVLTHHHQSANAPFVPRPPGFDALTQPRFLVRQALVELVPSDRFVGQPLVLLAKEGRVVTRPRGQPASEPRSPKARGREGRWEVRTFRVRDCGGFR